MNEKQDLFMMFDVESIGVHGEGFAVAYVVVNRAGQRLEECVYACPPDSCAGTKESRLWVAENIPSIQSEFTSPKQVRSAFWKAWKRWKEHGAVLAADCCWPVEARFLADCVDDHLKERELEGPYPLHDLASVLLARGQSPLALRARLADELPVHAPLADARQSARLLLDALKDSPSNMNPRPRPDK